MAAQTSPSPPAATLDPPFRGYIETTFDALLVFEAARRGMIPRVTRRLIERERSMVQSGAVFVFDEHESGIKRWTDGLIWSPSRILGNFLVYRQTDKGPGTKTSTHSIGQESPDGSSPSSTPQNRSSGNLPTYEAGPSFSTPLGQGQLHRPRSSSEGGTGVDRARERQLVGSLTNSYKFTSGGLVKKTMSVIVNDYAQHMISYYTMDDVLAGRLRTPSSIPELAALEIAPEYLTGQSFRFPPSVDYGPDGKPRYRGEPDIPKSPQSPSQPMSMQGYPPGEYYDPYNHQLPQHLRMEPSQSRRSINIPVAVPINSGSMPNYMPSNGPAYYDQMQPQPHSRQDSGSSPHSQHAVPQVMRPGSSSRRYDPYGGPPRAGSVNSPLQITHSQQLQNRRQSQPQPIHVSHEEYYGRQGYDVKPDISSGSYNYQPPSTAPGSFAQYYPTQHSPVTPHLPSVPAPYHGQQQYAASPWAVPPAAPTSRLLPAGTAQRDYHHPHHPPSSSGSSGSGGVADNWANHVGPGGAPAVWETGGMQYQSGVIPHAEEWRGNMV